MSINADNKDEQKKFSFKRIAALSAAVLLALLYVVTLIFAITDNPATMSFFKASAALTVIVPLLLYSYQLAYRVLKWLNDKNNHEE